MSFTTNIDMMTRVRTRDDEAWNAFSRRYAPLIRLHGRDCGLPPDLIDDLGQEVMLAVLRGERRPDRPFRPYLRAVIRNRACSLLRRLYRDRGPEPRRDPAEEAPEENAAEDDSERRQRREWQFHLLAHAVERLRRESAPLHFQVFDLMYHHGWKAGRVARFLRLPAATVYSIDRRNLAKLRACCALIDE